MICRSDKKVWLLVREFKIQHKNSAECYFAPAFCLHIRNSCFGSLVILDVVRCCLWLFALYINIKIGKNSC